jgi:hypothetical protein
MEKISHKDAGIARGRIDKGNGTNSAATFALYFP